jgi:hypothetical protein
LSPVLDPAQWLLAKVSREQLIFMSAFIVLALAIVIANDLWKQHLVRRAQLRGKRISDHWRQNRIDWRFVAVLIVGFAIYIYLLANPHLTNRDFGPFNPIIKHFFDDFDR